MDIEDRPPPKSLSVILDWPADYDKQRMMFETKSFISNKYSQMISKLESQFGISCDFKIQENVDSISIDNVRNEIKFFKRHNQLSIKFDMLNCLTLSCNGFAFKHKHSSTLTSLRVYFDKNFNILEGHFYSKYISQSLFLINETYLSFDKHFNLYDYVYHDRYIREHKKNVMRAKSKKMLLTFEEEMKLFRLSHHSNTPEITELLPEAYIQSAYDFNSEDFTTRMLTYQMITC